MLLDEKSNYFELLNIERTATERDIRLAYSKMLRQYSNEKFPQEFQLLTRAYQTLMDETKRAQYEKDLGDGGAAAEQRALLHQYIETGTFAQARNIVDTLLQQDDQDEELLLAAFTIASELNDETQEAVYARKLAQLPRQSEAVQTQLMYYYNRENQYAQAIYYAEQLYDQNKQDNERILHLITLYHRHNETTKVEQLFNTALQQLEPRLQNSVVFIDALFWAMNTDNAVLVERVETKLRHTIEQGQKLPLLRQLIDNGDDLQPDHYCFKYFVQLVERLNEGEYHYIQQWTDRHQDQILRRAAYYGDAKHFEHDVTPTPVMTATVPPTPMYEEPTYIQPTYEQTPTVQRHKERGSYGWALIFGLLTYFLTKEPLAAVVVVAVWYFFARFIKKVLSCLAIVVVIALVIIIALAFLTS